MAALALHPGVEAARAKEESAFEEERAEFSGFFPEFNTSITGGRMFGNNSTSRGLTVDRGEAYSYIWEGNASLTQPLFDGLETFRRVDAARSRLSSAAFNVADVREDLALRTAQAYIDILRTQALQAAAEKHREKINDYLKRIEEMVEEGAADESESAQAENLAILLDDTLARFEGQAQKTLAAYNEAVGRLPMGNLSKPVPRADMIFAMEEDAVAHARTSHPMILSSLLELEAAGYDVDAERGMLLPDLDGELSYLKRDQAEELGGEAIDARAVLRMSWRFATGGEGFARVRKSKAEYSETLARTRESVRQIEKDVHTAYAELRTASKQLELLHKRQEVVEGLFKAYEAQFEGARVRLLQLMQAENQLFTLKIERINAEYRQLLARFAVLAATGRFQESLGLMLSPYNAGPMPGLPVTAELNDTPPAAIAVPLPALPPLEQSTTLKGADPERVQLEEPSDMPVYNTYSMPEAVPVQAVEITESSSASTAIPVPAPPQRPVAVAPVVSPAAVASKPGERVYLDIYR